LPQSRHIGHVDTHENHLLHLTPSLKPAVNSSVNNLC
jgi:hypothetical protein